jgi:hypothetical protein
MPFSVPLSMARERLPVFCLEDMSSLYWLARNLGEMKEKSSNQPASFARRT